MSTHSSNVAVTLELLRNHQELDSTLKATRAREQFFPLLELVVRDDRQVVLIEHEDLPERAMLVSERYQLYVRQLETAVRALLRPAVTTGFAMAGSLALAQVDELERDIAELRAAEGRGQTGGTAHQQG